jgi:hypothetical protein
LGIIWINDDIDRTHIVNNDMFQTTTEQDDLDTAPDGKVDWQENIIPCERDLEDFTRLWIVLSGLHDALASGNIQVGLQWTDVSAGTPAIKLYPAFEPDGGSNYLSDPATSTQQIGLDYAIQDARDTSTPDIATNNVVGGTNVFILPTRIFQSYTRATQQTLHLLFEGVSAGSGRLKIVILDKAGNQIGEGPAVWMDLEPIRNFYQTWTVGDNASPGVHTDVTPALTYTSVAGSPTLPAPTLDEEKDFILFVHGWNMTTFEKNRFAETAYKRLWWQGYKGRFGAFRWPTYYTTAFGELTDSIGPPLDPQNFDASEQNSWNSAAGLRQLLTDLNSTYHDASGNSRVRVLAHSHGNIATSEALHQATVPLVQTYVASQAAIAAHCFDSDPTRIPDISGNWQNGHWYLTLLPVLNLNPVAVTTPNVYAYYPGKAGLDTSVQYPTAGQPYMTGAAGSGKWVNYYNQSDWALDGWITDQALKPDLTFGYNNPPGSIGDPQINGWWFFSESGFGTLQLLSVPGDTYAIFSHAAQARSQPLGRQPGVMGLFNGQQISWNQYGDKHPGHSAEFRSSIAQRGDYWQQLLISFALKAAP